MDIFNNAPIFLILIIASAIFVKIASRMNKTTASQEIEEILKNEQLATNTLRKAIDESYFIKPEIEDLPKILSDNECLLKAEQKVITRSKAKMMSLTSFKNNTDIKNTFGYNNFNKIITYEEQYNLFIQSLIFYAELLILNNYKKEAEKVLLMSYNLGSNYMKTYQLLFDIYANDKINAKAFLDNALNNDFLKANQVLISKIKTYADKVI